MNLKNNLKKIKNWKGFRNIMSIVYIPIDGYHIRKKQGAYLQLGCKKCWPKSWAYQDSNEEKQGSMAQSLLYI